MKGRIAYLARFYGVAVVVFVAAKPLFMLCNREGHPFTLADVGQVACHGLSLDLSTALYFLLFPFLVMVISLWWSRWKVLRILLKAYTAIVALALALAFVADTSLYKFWGFKLNASVLQYLEQPEGIVASVSWGYLLLRLVVLLAVAYLIYMMGRPPKSVAVITRKARVAGSGVALLLVPLLVVGIRGGIEVSTTNVGQVFYSPDPFLNNSAVNPVFSFLSSLGHGQDDYDQYHFFTDEECRQLLQDAYTTESRLADTLLAVRRPNVIVILMESAGGVFTELGGRKDVMPRLNQLAREGVAFTQCYANSWRTDRGTVCTLSGYPSFPSFSVMKNPEKSRTMPSLARTLQRAGYQTTYLYGGDINFTNMRAYLVSTGWERLVSLEDYPLTEARDLKWGIHDHVTFQTLYQLATTRQEPWLIGFSTLSSHEPWEVPMQPKFQDKVLNSFYYLDLCLGRFIDQFRKTPQWANTLIVLLPDHGINYKHLDETDPLRNHIPLVWTGGAVRRPFVVDKLCNQTDLAATLLGQLGLPHDDFAFSRDVLSQTYTRPFAVHNYSNAQSLIDSTGFILYDFSARRFVVKQSAEAARMLRLSKAVLQQTSQDLKRR